MPTQQMPIGRLIHKGYSLRQLAAHNCTTGGFLTAFKFWGLVGSTSYFVYNFRFD